MAIEIPGRAIRDSAAAGDLWQIALALAGAASNWDATAQGGWKTYWGGPAISGYSPGAFATAYGYTLWDTDGGLGDSIAPAILLDGPTHMRLTADVIRTGMRQSKGDMYTALAPWPTRAAAWGLYRRIQTEGIEIAETGEIIPPTALDNGAPGAWAPIAPVEIAGVEIPGSVVPVLVGLAVVGLIIAVTN